jgi:peptidylamidoglycolate lyase
LSVTGFGQQKGGDDETGPYQVIEKWPEPFERPGAPMGSALVPGKASAGSSSAVFAETPNRIFLGNRLGEMPKADTPKLRNSIVIVDGNGKLLDAWVQYDHLFQGGRGPHKIKISPYDPQHSVWVIDDTRHQILKFTNDGKELLLTLGEPGVPGNDENHFARPTDIAWLPDGTFFVSDGYINTRVMKFDKNGKFLMTWGTKGNSPGQFNLPHSVDIDRQRRVYVADRANSRVQVFDENGKYLDQWPNIRQPFHIMITPDQHMWVTDGVTSKFLEFNLDGKLLYSWGTYGTFPGAFWGVHQFSVDSEGNLYVAEDNGGRYQKYRPAPGGERAKLIEAPAPLMPPAAAHKIH